MFWGSKFSGITGAGDAVSPTRYWAITETLRFDDVHLNGHSRIGAAEPLKRYAGFAWRDIGVINPNEKTPSGYLAGIVSRENVAYTYPGGGSITAPGNFTFRSGFFTAAWTDGLEVTFRGYDDGKLLYTKVVTLHTQGPILFDFDFREIDTLQIAGSGQVVLDDLVFEVTAGAIAGTVTNDLNGNGAADDSEPGLKGRTIILDDNGNGVVDDGEVTAITNASGAYRFAVVAPGDHTITQVLPPHWAQTGGTRAVFVDSGETARADLLAADVRTTTGDVAGILFHDYDADGMRDSREPGFAGWTVYVDADGDGKRDADERFAVTDDHGRFSITVVTPGEATVRVDLPTPGWEAWHASDATVTVVASATTEGVDLAVVGGATPDDDHIIALGSDDTILALGGADFVSGRGGNDVIDGGSGDDELFGRRGDDLLFGGQGDRMSGGLGADTFAVDGRGADRIGDFDAAEGDRILIDADGVDDFSALVITDHNGSATIGWAGTDLAVLVHGVAAASLDPSMFVFGA